MTHDSHLRIDLPVLDRYLAGTATPDECAEVTAALGRDAELRRLADVLRAVGHEPSASREQDVERAWQKDWQRINAPAVESGASRNEKRKTGFVTWLAGVAAIVSVVFLLAQPHVTRNAGIRTYTTGAGQQGFVTLADSTRVTLAPHTTLHVAESDAHVRTVKLDGEAYFDVARSSGAPFLVQSGAFTTRVLGTAFIVKHVPGTARVLVSVAEGKVRVTSDTRRLVNVTLTAGAIGDIRDTTTVVSTIEELAPGTELLRGKLVFHHTPVSTVLATLSRWYGYQFRCVDPTLSQQYVTIGVSMRSSASALAALEEILGVSLNVVGDTVTLIPHGDRPVQATPRVRTYDIWTPVREVGR